MGLLDLLKIKELSKMLCNIQTHQYICCSDALSNQKHFHGQMLLQVGYKLINLCSLSELNETNNFKPIFGVLLCKKNLIEVSSLGHLHHDRDWIRAAYPLIILTCFDKHWNLHGVFF